MNRHFNVTLIILLGIGLTLSVALNFYLTFKGKQKDYALRDFAILHNIPIEYTKKEIKNIEKYASKANVPVNLQKAIGMSEKGLGSHTFGVKRIRLETQIKYDIDLWQLVDSINIVKEEIYGYCFLNNKTFPNEKAMC